VAQEVARLARDKVARQLVATQVVDKMLRRAAAVEGSAVGDGDAAVAVARPMAPAELGLT